MTRRSPQPGDRWLRDGSLIRGQNSTGSSACQELFSLLRRYFLIWRYNSIIMAATMKINTKKMERARKATGMGKMAFSRKCGMTDSTYGKILQSKSTTLKTLTTIAEILNVDPKDLLI